MSNDIIDKLKTKIINSGTQTQKSDRFNVRFLGIPENLSDFLSRQVRNITPSSVTFQMMNHSNRRATFQNVGKIETEMLNITFIGDDEGIVDAILTTQVFRQKGDVISGFEESDRDTFDVSIESLNMRGEVVKKETYKKCRIMTYQKPDFDTSADSPMMYTLTVTYDSIDYSYEENSFFLNTL